MCERTASSELAHAIKRAMYEAHSSFHIMIFKRFASFESSTLLEVTEFMQSREQHLKHSFCMSVHLSVILLKALKLEIVLKLST